MVFLSIMLSSFLWAQSGLIPALPDMPPIPKDNPQTKDKVELGKMLYFDPRISVDGTVSCNSCHNVMYRGGDDSRPSSAGVNGHRGDRGAGTVFNSGFYSVLFWDGRSPSLEDQAQGPMTNPIEMGNKDHEVVLKRIAKIPGYMRWFKKVFKGKKPVTLDNMTKAIAAYERTLNTPNSPFDKFVKGDKKAISPLAQKGYKTFQAVGCITCHNGPILAGPQLPAGSGYFMKFPTYPNTSYDKKYKFTEDLGRFKVTKNNADKYMFRVPTLRNIEFTAPYFHNGKVKTLAEAVKVMAKTQLNKDIKANQVKEIVAFLKTLSGNIPPQTMPILPALSEASVVSAK